MAPEARDELAGFESALVLSGGMRTAIEGSVQGRPAEVVLELAEPISSVTRSCFEGAPPESNTTVRYPSWRGGLRQAPEIELHGARIGQRRIGALHAALIEGQPCRVTLGSDVLGAYALWIDPASRTVRLVASRERGAYQAEARASQQGEEVSLVDLERDPSADWPMLTIRARRDRSELIGPMVLTTGAEHSTLSGASVSSAQLRPGSALSSERSSSTGGLRAPKSGGDELELDEIELAPGIAIRNAAARVDPGWKGTAQGTLGGEAWGRFRVVVDARAGVLLLRRPKVITTEGRPHCGSPSASDEGCLELHQRASPHGIELAATVWRDLPGGASVQLEVLDAQGALLASSCRLGFTFTRAGRGVSTVHRLPWSEMAAASPRCAQALATGTSVRFSRWQDEPVKECPGACAFVEDLEAGRLSCDCHGTSEPMGQAAQRHEPLRLAPREPSPASDEPSEPEN